MSPSLKDDMLCFEYPDPGRKAASIWLFIEALPNCLGAVPPPNPFEADDMTVPGPTPNPPGCFLSTEPFNGELGPPNDPAC